MSLTFAENRSGIIKVHPLFWGIILIDLLLMCGFYAMVFMLDYTCESRSDNNQNIHNLKKNVYTHTHALYFDVYFKNYIYYQDMA